jgi:hypothetical protein
MMGALRLRGISLLREIREQGICAATHSVALKAVNTSNFFHPRQTSFPSR